MVSQKEHLNILLKNALEAFDSADIQRARDLILAVQVEVEKLEEPAFISLHVSADYKRHGHDALLKEFGW